MRIIQNRRHFLAGAAAAGAAALFNIRPSSAAGEPPPETTTVRLREMGSSSAGQAVVLAGELMRADGITDVRWVTGDTQRRQFAVARSWRYGFRYEHALDAHHVHRGRGADQGADRCAYGLLRTDRQRQRPHRHGYAGQAGRGLPPGFAPAQADEPHGQLCRARSRPRYPMGRDQKPDARFSRREGRRGPRPPRPNRRCCAPGRTSPATRSSTSRSTAHGRNISAAWSPRQHGLRDQVPGGDKTCRSRHPQGRRLLRFEPGFGCAGAGRSRLSARLRLRPGQR